MNDPSKQTAWERWELGSLGESQSPRPTAEKATAVRLPTAAEIEQMHQQARDEGFATGKEEGYRAGVQAGQAAGQAAAQRLAALAGKLEQGLQALDATVADELLALACEIARAVICQELSVRPESLMQVVREALAQLPHQHAAIYLHPEDASLLRSYMGDQLGHAGHRIHEDFKLARGDCVLEAGSSQVDATVAARWRRVIDTLGIAAAWSPAMAAAPGTGLNDAP